MSECDLFKVTDIKKGRIVKELKFHCQEVTDVKFSPVLNQDGTEHMVSMVTAAKDNTVILYDATDGKFHYLTALKTESPI